MTPMLIATTITNTTDLSGTLIKAGEQLFRQAAASDRPPSRHSSRYRVEGRHSAKRQKMSKLIHFGISRATCEKLQFNVFAPDLTRL
jgi:hypothetical protein